MTESKATTPQGTVWLFDKAREQAATMLEKIFALGVEAPDPLTELNVAVDSKGRCAGGHSEDTRSRPATCQIRLRR